MNHTLGKTIAIPITKRWTGTPAEQVQIKLFADGAEKATATLTADTDWQYTFTDLPKYDSADGHEIAYTVPKVKVDGYLTEISGDAESGFVVTNRKLNDGGEGSFPNSANADLDAIKTLDE